MGEGAVLGAPALSVPAPDARAAADALVRAAEGAGRNVERVRPAWLVAEAERLRGRA
ncbi:hypothetical protein OHT61_15520 [Streptomyces sp. NBC_00178]|uniref:hypothetical protein n=1 Tax=Streptomyces sp. NBC_00178 TaxID=2975672 RepID=UPI002E27D9D0|nr:hypothetical protein [Streptomyces sp. NBC_00178]